MKIDVSKNELVSIIYSGPCPNYQQMEDEPFKDLGKWNGSYDAWVWSRRALLDLPEAKLLDLREILKTSWSK